MRFRVLKAGRLAKGFRSEEVPIGFESKHALNNIKRMGTYYIIAQLHEFYINSKRVCRQVYEHVKDIKSVANKELFVRGNWGRVLHTCVRLLFDVATWIHLSRMCSCRSSEDVVLFTVTLRLFTN